MIEGLGVAGTVLTLVGVLVGIVGLIAFVSVYFRATTQNLRIERLKGENTDYLSRLNYVEPKLEALERQNKVLLQLTDPTDRLDKIDAKLDSVNGELREQGVALADIRAHIHPEGPR